MVGAGDWRLCGGTLRPDGQASDSYLGRWAPRNSHTSLQSLSIFAKTSYCSGSTPDRRRLWLVANRFGKRNKPACNVGPPSSGKLLLNRVLTYATVSRAATKACAPVLPLHGHCSHGHLLQGSCPEGERECRWVLQAL